MIKVSIGLHNLHQWFDGDYRQLVQLVKMADDKGIDCVTVTDHLFLTNDIGHYPGGALEPDFPWYEPMSILSAIAIITERIRLSTSIMLAPLRPAVLLAKQLATLDCISHGRVDAGFGVGWHRPELDAAGAPWDHRFTYMTEQVEACRLLWTTAPANFDGRWIKFQDAYAYPMPKQAGGPPIWFGFAATPRNIDRMARHADGWLPMFKDDPELIRTTVDRVREGMAKYGRGPDGFGVRMPLRPVPGRDGKPDLDATLGTAEAFIRAGLTVVELYPSHFCAGPDDFEGLLDKLLQVKS